jgi:hypothetical protein
LPITARLTRLLSRSRGVGDVAHPRPSGPSSREAVTTSAWLLQQQHLTD